MCWEKTKELISKWHKDMGNFNYKWALKFILNNLLSQIDSQTTGHLTKSNLFLDKL